MTTIIKKFNSREEVIAMRSKMSSTYATIVSSADKSGLEKRTLCRSFSQTSNNSFWINFSM